MKKTVPSKSLQLQFLLTAKQFSDLEFLICHVTNWFNGLVVLWVEPLDSQSPLYQGWGSCTLQNRRYYVINFSCNFTEVRSQWVIWFHGWLSVVIVHYPAKFGDDRPCRRGDIVFNLTRDLLWSLDQRVT